MALGWGVVVWALGACASAPLPPEPSEAPATVEPMSLASEVEASLERNAWLLEHGNEDDRVRAHLGLGDAYWDQATLKSEQRYALDERAWDAAEAERPELDRQRDALERERVELLEDAAAEYRRVLEAEGTTAVELRPRARFGLAGVLEIRGDRSGAVVELEALVRDDPEHPLAAPAWARLGDVAFEEERLDDAATAFTRALRAQSHRDRLYARYRLGWVERDRDGPQAALDQWTQVVLEGRAIPGGESLASVAAKDCMRVFVEVGRPEEASAFFMRLHPERASELLQLLASRYRELGRPEDAARVLGQPVPPPSSSP